MRSCETGDRQNTFARPVLGSTRTISVGAGYLGHR